jgi:hypothetical protein
MSILKCSNCGNALPENSNFCNHCGTKIEHNIICKNCGHEAPSGSRFCTQCGHSFNEVQASAPINALAHNNDSLGWNFNDENEDHDTPTPAPAYAAEQAPKRKRSARPFVAALLTAIILGVAGYIYYMMEFAPAKTATDVPMQVVDVPLTPDEAKDILIKALKNSNISASKTAFALEVNRNTDGLKQIVGVTYNSQTEGKSSYQIYTLEADSVGDNWKITNTLHHDIAYRKLIFDQNIVAGEHKQLPKLITSIGETCYVHFAYAALPTDNSNLGEVVMALFDTNSHRLTTVDFAGEVMNRDEKTLIKGVAENVFRSYETEFLIAEAESVAMIYRPTPEELELEKAKNAAKKWLADNSEKIDSVRNGEVDIRLNITVYNQPIFSLENTNTDSTIENENLIVTADTNGNVYGFSKTKRRYFVVYAPSTTLNETPLLEFILDGSVRVKTSDIDFVFNPRNCAASAVDIFE